MADKKKVFEYLNVLRDSGIVNMFGSGAYVQRTFNVTSEEANKFVLDWMAEKEKNSDRTDGIL